MRLLPGLQRSEGRLAAKGCRSQQNEETGHPQVTCRRLAGQDVTRWSCGLTQRLKPLMRKPDLTCTLSSLDLKGNLTTVILRLWLICEGLLRFWRRSLVCLSSSDSFALWKPSDHLSGDVAPDPSLLLSVCGTARGVKSEGSKRTSCCFLTDASFPFCFYRLRFEPSPRLKTTLEVQTWLTPPVCECEPQAWSSSVCVCVCVYWRRSSLCAGSWRWASGWRACPGWRWRPRGRAAGSPGAPALSSDGRGGVWMGWTWCLQLGPLWLWKLNFIIYNKQKFWNKILMFLKSF